MSCTDIVGKEEEATRMESREGGGGHKGELYR